MSRIRYDWWKRRKSGDAQTAFAESDAVVNFDNREELLELVKTKGTL